MSPPLNRDEDAASKHDSGRGNARRMSVPAASLSSQPRLSNRRASMVSHRSLSRVSEADAPARPRARSETRPGAERPSRRNSCANLPQHKRASSEHGKKDAQMGPYHAPGSQAKPFTGRERCYDQPKHHVRAACHDNFVWDHGKYVRDDCGSGIVPKRFNFMPSRKLWCKTPLSMYQATIGELGRQILCREKVVARDVKPGPPCNVCECILPPCGGYYRRYDCLRPCEEEYATMKQGHKTYRDRIQRYWEPCLTQEQKSHLDVNTYAGHNVYLGLRMRRKNHDLPCW